MKIIFSNSLLSIILKIVFHIPLLMGIILMIIDPPRLIPFWVGMIIFSQSSLLFMFNSLYGYIILKSESIFVPNDLIIKHFRLQEKTIIKTKDIIAIEFAEEQCDSEGNAIPEGRRGPFEFLKIYTSDGQTKRIHLAKFSFKTWERIGSFLLEKNSDILVMRSAKKFKECKKTGIFKD